MASYKQRLKRSWKFLVAIITPIVLLPVLFVNDHEIIPVPDISYKSGTLADDTIEGADDNSYKESPKFKLAYVILVMAVYWALEILPLPVTSLFPLVMFPLFGIDDAANVSKSYMKESNTIFLGSAIVAIAVEYCNLHRRVGLRLIRIVGVSPKRLMFGIMAVVAFLSMWISNTTCVTMIVPIIVAIVHEIHEVADATTSQTLGESNFPSNQNQINNLNANNTQSGNNSPSMRHSSVFANRALSSHDNRHHHHHNNLSQTNHSSRSSRRSSRNNEQPYTIPEENNNLRNSLTSAEPLQLTIIKNELNSERNSTIQNGVNRNELGQPPQNNDRDFKNNPLRRPTLSSLVQPARLGAMIVDLPSPTQSECEEGLDKQAILEREKWRRIKNMYLFALAYAANIGGTATITGTGPNKVFKEVIKPYASDISQDGKYLGMTFFTWMALNLPPMLINIVVAWCYLTFKYCGLPKLRSRNSQEKAEHALKKWKEQHVRQYIVEEYKKLGKMTFHEIGVALVFLLVVFLWIFRDPQFFKGWDETISHAQTGDSTAALLGAVLLFIIPKNWNFLTSKDGAVPEALLDWKFVTQKMPWGVLLLLGSGYAIGDSASRTGLSKWIGQELYLLHDLDEHWLLLIVMLITTLITEVVSNTAAASVILPVLLGLSKEMGTHPLYLSVSVAVTAGYAFMLPVASPVNAIVFAAGDFSIWEMISNGYFLTISCVFVFYVNTLTLGEYMFNYSGFSYPVPPTTLTTISTTTAAAFFNSTGSSA